MPRRLSKHSDFPAVSDIASAEALHSVFACPEIEPARLDPMTLQQDPESIPIPGESEAEGALSLAKGLALMIHQPPEGEDGRRRLAEGISQILIRLAKAHPMAALHAIDAARAASMADTPRTSPTRKDMNLFIRVAVNLAHDPAFRQLIESNYT